MSSCSESSSAWFVSELLLVLSVLDSRFSQWSRGKVALSMERLLPNFEKGTAAELHPLLRPLMVRFESQGSLLYGVSVIQLKLRVPTSRPPTSWGKPSCLYHRLECHETTATLLLPHAISKVTVGSNPILVEFKGRSDMMIKVPASLVGLIHWMGSGRATVVTQVGAQFTDLSETEKRLVPQLGYEWI